MNKHNGKSKPFTLVLRAALMLLSFAAALLFLVYATQLRGKSSLLRNNESPSVPSRTDGVDEQELAEKLQRLDSVDVIIDGVGYSYRDDLINIVLLGVDKNKLDDEGRHQCDLIMLAVFDTKNDKLSLIAVPRDTMTDIDFYSDSGAFLYTRQAQLALAYGYGKDDLDSGELVKKAVSNLFYQLPIHGQFTLFMDAIPMLNDAVGGVTLTLDEDMPELGWGMSKGTVVTLNGQQAQEYVRSRDISELDSSLKRLSHQKRYMTAFLSKARYTLSSDPTKITEIIRELQRGCSSDIPNSSMLYLATEALSMNIGDVMIVDGEIANNDHIWMEYNADDDILYNLVIDLFYEKVDN